MTESTPATDTLAPIERTGNHVHRNTRLYQVLAWVGIVAGILFIVAVVFFSGVFAARATGGVGWHRGNQSGQMGPDGPMSGSCPMMQMQGGMGPGGMAPGGARPSTPSSPAPMPMMPPPAGQR